MAAVVCCGMVAVDTTRETPRPPSFPRTNRQNLARNQNFLFFAKSKIFQKKISVQNEVGNLMLPISGRGRLDVFWRVWLYASGRRWLDICGRRRLYAYGRGRLYASVRGRLDVPSRISNTNPASHTKTAKWSLRRPPDVRRFKPDLFAIRLA